MASQVEITPLSSEMAFGELLGIDVPTRYSPHVHAAVDTVLSINSLIAPPVLGMSQRTILLCRLLAGLITMLQVDNDELPFRRRLELKSMVGVLLAAMAVQGILVRRPLDRAYVLFLAMALIANSLMVEVG